MIELKRENSYIKIVSPYDDELKSSISDLDKSERKWDGKCWLVVESKLDWIRELAQECAERRGWTVRDYTNLRSDAEISERQNLDNEKESRDRVHAIIELFPLLPKRILKLVRWNNSTIRLQLTRLLDDKALFDRLYRASQSAFKVQAIASFDPKQSFGFAFDIDNHPDVIEALLKLEVEYLKKHSVSTVKQLARNAFWLTNTEGVELIGLKIEDIDLSDINHTSQSWELAVTGDTVYWVAETERFITAWVSEDSYRIMSAGGAIAHCIPKDSAALVSIIKQWELETWFSSWSRQLLLSEGFKHSGKGWAEWEWNHPSDELIRHLKKFKGDHGVQPFIGIDCSTLVNRIETCKQELARLKKEDARSKANTLAGFKLREKYDTKAKLLKLAESRQVEIKKSWTVDRIIDAICSDRQYCLKVLGLE
ncbi:hypothetical protein QT972_22750 [Microcoleus sp. herbarium7]|uniref:hypothetical protein n=1 Tax=Microcoleus sp. herbarium7 TaxID=3055435 RepID=UPI002FD12CC7